MHDSLPSVTRKPYYITQYPLLLDRVIEDDMQSSFEPDQPIDHNFTPRINPESCCKDTVPETPRVEWEFSSNALDGADLEAPDELRANRESSLNTAEGMTLTSNQPPIPFVVSDHSQIRRNEAVIRCMKA